MILQFMTLILVIASFFVDKLNCKMTKKARMAEACSNLLVHGAADSLIEDDPSVYLFIGKSYFTFNTTTKTVTNASSTSTLFRNMSANFHTAGSTQNFNIKNVFAFVTDNTVIFYLYSNNEVDDSKVARMEFPTKSLLKSIDSQMAQKKDDCVGFDCTKDGQCNVWVVHNGVDHESWDSIYCPIDKSFSVITCKLSEGRIEQIPIVYSMNDKVLPAPCKGFTLRKLEDEEVISMVWVTDDTVYYLRNGQLEYSLSLTTLFGCPSPYLTGFVVTSLILTAFVALVIIPAIIIVVARRSKRGSFCENNTTLTQDKVAKSIDNNNENNNVNDARKSPKSLLVKSEGSAKVS